jgi:large subunit ribosomal protein L23
MRFFKRKTKEESEKISQKIAEKGNALPEDAKVATVQKPVAPKVQQSAPNQFIKAHNIESILRHPRITEKATGGIEHSVYVFDVLPKANKHQIKVAVKHIYNVEPIKIHVVNVPSKRVRSAKTGMKGVKSGGKKAYVYLKRGDSITLT